MKSTKSSWKFLRRALRCNTRAKWHFVIRLHTKWIKCCSRNRMDDAMFKVAESIVLSWRRLSCQIYKRSSQLCGAKLWCMNIYTGQKCRITVYPLTCQHYICPIGLHSTICKGNADYSTLNREHFVMPKGRSDSPMGTGDELGHQNASNTHTHTCRVLCVTDFLWRHSRRRDSSPNRCEISMEDFIAESSPAEQLVLLMFEFLTFLDSWSMW